LFGGGNSEPDISVGNAMVSCAFVACNMPAIIGAYYMQKLYATIEYVYSPKKAEIAHTHTHTIKVKIMKKNHTQLHIQLKRLKSALYIAGIEQSSCRFSWWTIAHETMSKIIVQLSHKNYINNYT